MADIKPMAEIQEKWVRVTPGRQGDYAKGVQRAGGQKWEAATTAGADNFAQGVQQAIAEGRFAAGVSGAGQKWAKKAADVGAGRFAAGVQASGPDYAAGFSPFHAVIAGTQLPARFPRGDERNYDRSRAIGVALNRARRA